MQRFPDPVTSVASDHDEEVIAVVIAMVTNEAVVCFALYST